MLNTPNGAPGPRIDVYSSKVPEPKDVVLVPQPILRTASKILEKFKGGIAAKWAIGGDAGEVMLGVNVTPEHIEIITTKEGCEEIVKALAEYQPSAPVMVEREHPRKAEIDGAMLPVYTRSYYSELRIDGVKVEVHGDEQIKVGEWDWGDPLDFKPEYAYIAAGKLPLVPLTLKSELDIGLGWLDRVKLISDAVLQKHHSH